MICTGCGEKNRDGARFCLFCGTSLAARCSVCDNELPSGARFCDSCGTPVDAVRAPAAAARKVVTVLFTDLTGSTALEERMDAESVRAVLDRFYGAMRRETERFGGVVVKFTGDGAMSAFGIPDVKEDDASRAVDAALAMRAECEELASDLGLPLALKIGVNTGEVVVSEADEDIVGDCVNVAARLEGAARAGEILVGEETWRLTRGTSRYEAVPPLTLKGKSEPVPAFRLLAVDERTAEAATAPFVGRETELGRLLAAFQDAVDANAARMVTIIGSPGLGKTRLARELTRELEGQARIRETRCDPGGAATFAPIADALRAAAGIEDAAGEQEVIDALLAFLPPDMEDRQRIAERAAPILGVGHAGSTEETFWALRRVIETAAQIDPVVLVLDDLHWAEPLLLDLVEHLAEWIKDAPVLLVGTARPELRDLRPSLAEGGRAAAVIALEGLDGSATAQLALNLLGTDELPAELLATIPSSTEGNPLFVREFVRMLVEDGVLLRGLDGWDLTVDVEAIQVPPTIQSLLAARVDRLRADERAFLEIAAVVGKEFYRGVLSELAPQSIREQLDGCLESLRRKELVEPAGTYWIDEPVFRFHHVLIRDAAYRRLLKESRAELHERVAEWLERKTEHVLGEHDELIGYHLEQAHENRQQLGKTDVALGIRAAGLLGGAARRALDSDDLPAAAGLSGRALARIPADGASRPELLLVRCEALLSMGDIASGAAAVEELDDLADSPRLSSWATCFRGQLVTLTSPERLHETEKHVAAAATQLADVDDQAGAAKAHTVHAATLARLGRFAECESVLDQALTAARAANDRRRITAVLGSAPHAALWGPSPVSRAGGRCLDIVRLLRITTGSPAVEATSLRCQAVLEAFRGRADAARRMLRSARRTLTELGLRHELLEAEQFAGVVELVAGDAAAAESHLRAAYDGFHAVGVDVLAAQSAALLARAHLLLGEVDDAARFVEESERLGGQDLKASIAWRAVKAELLARRGEFAEARRLAEAAVELAGRTDALIDHGDACRALAEVCAAAGDAAAARSASDRALALYERKGATALVERPVPDADEHVPVLEQAAGPSNAAAAVYLRFGAFFEGRDWDGLRSLVAPDVRFEDRRTGMSDDHVGVDAHVEAMEAAAGVAERFEVEPIAVRGDRLALVRMRATGRSNQGFETEFLSVGELDDAGRLSAMTSFDPDDLPAAVGLLDDRFFAIERVSQAARELGFAINENDWDRMRAAVADDVVIVDHRPASLGEIRGADDYVAAVRNLKDVVPDLFMFVVQAHAIESDGAVMEMAGRGTTTEGTPIEFRFYNVGVADSDERLARAEWFPLDQLDQALARFREIRSGAPSGPRENACSRSVHRAIERMNAGDLDSMREINHPDVVVEDRRPVLRSELAGIDAGLANLALALGGRPRIEARTIATREERFALISTVWFGSEPTEYVVEIVNVFEVDEHGIISTVIQFDASDIDAAFAELDERYVASSDARVEVTLGLRLIQGLNARDWDSIRALSAPGLAVVDHTPASRGQMDIDDYITSLQGLVSLAPDLRTRLIEIEAVVDGLSMGRAWNAGASGDGVVFEISYHVLGVVEGDKFARLELFPIDELDAALARFEELSSVAGGPRSLENSCTRVSDRVRAAYLAGDLDAVTECYSSDSRLEDRRPGFRSSTVGQRAVLDHLKVAADLGGTRVRSDVIAVRGERLALSRSRVSSAEGYEVVILALEEIDDQRRVCTSVWFIEDQLDEALAELDRRFIDADGAHGAAIVTEIARGIRLINARDWDGYRALVEGYGDGFTFVDRRPASLGALADPQDLVTAQAALVELVPDLRTDLVSYAALEPDRCVALCRIGGTTVDGSDLDLSIAVVAKMSGPRMERLEYFPIGDLDAALERFRELDGTDRTRSWRLENAATRVMERDRDLEALEDWDALAEDIADDAVVEDLRPGFGWRIEGKTAVLEHVRHATAGVHVDLDVLAIRGERLALERQTVTHGDYVIELLTLCELGADGRIRRTAIFAPEDLDAAFADLDKRYLSGEGAPYEEAWTSVLSSAAAYNARDWERLAMRLSEGHVLIDHRPASLGRLGKREVVDNLSQMTQVVSDLVMRVITIHAIDVDRVVYGTQAVGTNSSGGSIELDFIVCDAMSSGASVKTEFFPVDQLDAALQNFEALADRRSTLENDAVRAYLEAYAAAGRGDEDWATRYFDPGIVLDERRRGLTWEISGERLYEHAQGMVASADETATVVAVRGRRLALIRQLERSPEGWEVEAISVIGLGSDGRIAHVVTFDPDGIGAAFSELERRYFAGEGEPYPDWLNIDDFRRAHAERDWERFGAHATEDVVMIDHRPASFGRLEGRDAFVSYFRAMTDLAPDLTMFPQAVHRITATHIVTTLVAHGTTQAGSPIELVSHIVGVRVGGKNALLEVFPEDGLDGAIARFDELVGAETDPVPLGNACTENWARAQELYTSRDWEGYAGLLSPTIRMEDRRTGLGSLVEGIDRFIDQVKIIAAMGPVAQSDVVATQGNDAAVLKLRWSDPAGSSAVEVEAVHVHRLGPDGKLASVVVFDTDAFDAALAELDGAGSSGLENACVRANRELVRRFHEQDWDGIRAMYGPGHGNDDRRSGLKTSLPSPEEAVENLKAVHEVGGRRWTVDPIATRGERLALIRFVIEGTDDRSFESDVLVVSEIDAEGTFCGTAIVFDPDDVDGAFEALDERFIATEGAPYADLLRRGSEQRAAAASADYDTYRKLTAPDVVLVDHRRASLGTVKGIDDVIEALRGFAPLIRGVRIRVVAYHAIASDLILTEIAAVGTARHGGPIEVAHLRLQQTIDGRVARMELFELDDLDRAKERFGEIRSEAAGDDFYDEADAESATAAVADPDGPKDLEVPAPIEPNEAFRAQTRSIRLQGAGDWGAVAETIADDVVFEDRRTGLAWRLEGKAAVLEHLKVSFSVGGRSEETLIGTRGERVCLSRQVVKSLGFEVALLVVNEFDASGHCCRCVFLGDDALDAAFVELDDRYVEGEGASYAEIFDVLHPVLALFNSNDWEAIRTRFADAVVVDHRPVSFGDAAGIDALIVGADLVRDIRFRLTEIPLIEHNAALARFHVVGTTHDGATLDWPLYMLVVLGDAVHAEMFGLDQLEAAKRRFAEIRDNGI